MIRWRSASLRGAGSLDAKTEGVNTMKRAQESNPSASVVNNFMSIPRAKRPIKAMISIHEPPKTVKICKEFTYIYVGISLTTLPLEKGVHDLIRPFVVRSMAFSL